MSEGLSLKRSGVSSNQKRLSRDNNSHKVSETNSSIHVKWCTTGKVEFLFFKSFLLVLTKLSFWQGVMALRHHSMKFRQFTDIS